MGSPNSERITAALLRIKGMNVDITSDRIRVCSLLSDMEPELKREQRRVKAMYETGAIRSIVLAIKSTSGAKMYLLRAAQTLAENADMTDAAAVETVNYFVPLWYGLPKLDEMASFSAFEDVLANLPEDDASDYEAPRKMPHAFADSVSASGAQQLTNELCRRYRSWMEGGTKDPIRAERLGWRAMKLTMLMPQRAAAMWHDAVTLGGVEQLSLCGRQILAWNKRLMLEASLGFACVYTGVVQGAQRGYFALGYCYHNGVGICRCPELAEKYYRLAAAVEPELNETIGRYLAALSAGRGYNDGEWRFH